MFFVPEEIREIRRFSAFQRWHLVGKAPVLIPDALRVDGLVVVKHFFDFGIRQCPGLPQRPVLRRTLLLECKALVHKQYAVLPVPDVCPACQMVGVFHAGLKHQLAFVVDPEERVHVVAEQGKFFSYISCAHYSPSSSPAFIVAPMNPNMLFFASESAPRNSSQKFA